MTTAPPSISSWQLTRSFDSPQGKIVWDNFGPDDAPDVVLLHGTPNWSFLWRNVVAELRDEFRIHVFDWPGFGGSDKYAGQNVSWDEQARRLPELFDAWSVRAPVVVAFDFAPIFALRAHLFARLDVSGFVFVDAAVLPPFVTDFSRVARDNMGTMRQLPTYVAEAAIAAHLAQTTYRPMGEDVLAQYLQPWRGPDGVAAYWRAIMAYDEDLAAPLAALLPELRVPTRVLWGEQDAWLPLRMGRDLADALPAAEFRTIPDAGHFSPEDNPKAVATQVREFVLDVRSRPPTTAGAGRR